jgi:heptosyltransferase-1
LWNTFMQDRGPRILVVRLGAMGDVIHALPAVSTLRASFPRAEIAWVIDPKWAPLVVGNPAVDRVLPFDRRDLASARASVTTLRAHGFDLAIDFQGLIKSAFLASVSGCRRRIGFHWKEVRERPAALLYTDRVHTQARHVAEKNIELAVAAGASTLDRSTYLPQGSPEGLLPAKPFVLACPLAGWVSKQWPIAYFRELARKVPLVVNGAPANEAELRQIEGAHVHLSGIEGLLDATRRAAAVVGVDSGPLHIAAAMGKPGVAIFGPTDPERNGPLGTSIRVLRVQGATTTYKRGARLSESMQAIPPEMVLDALGGLVPGEEREADAGNRRRQEAP